jgi:hypothetical protein
MEEVGQGGLTPGWTARGWPAPPSGVGPLLLLSLPPSGYFHLLVIYEFLYISLELLIFRNMVNWIYATTTFTL